MHKARLKVREAGGTMSIVSVQHGQPAHGTRIMLTFPYSPPDVEDAVSIDEAERKRRTRPL